MIGAVSGPHSAQIEVSATLIKLFCAAVQDPNPQYWDEDVVGGIVAPPAMLMTWLMPLEWTPTGQRSENLLAATVPLPGAILINVSNEAEFHADARPGDKLSVTERLVEVSPRKTTSVGSGHFITTCSTYRNQRDELIGEITNVMFRFEAPEA